MTRTQRKGTYWVLTPTNKLGNLMYGPFPNMPESLKMVQRLKEEWKKEKWGIQEGRFTVSILKVMEETNFA